MYRVITEDASTFSCLSKDLDFPSPLGTVDALYTSKFSLMDYLEDKWVMSLWQKMQTSLSSLWVVWTWKRIEFQLVVRISSNQICLPRTKNVLVADDWTKVLFQFCCYCQYCKWKNIMLFVVVTMWKFPDLMLLQLYVSWRLICSLGNFFLQPQSLY